MKAKQCGKLSVVALAAAVSLGGLFAAPAPVAPEISLKVLEPSLPMAFPFLPGYSLKAPLVPFASEHSTALQKNPAPMRTGSDMVLLKLSGSGQMQRAQIAYATTNGYAVGWFRRTDVLGFAGCSPCKQGRFDSGGRAYLKYAANGCGRPTLYGRAWGRLVGTLVCERRAGKEAISYLNLGDGGTVGRHKLKSRLRIIKMQWNYRAEDYNQKVAEFLSEGPYQHGRKWGRGRWTMLSPGVPHGACNGLATDFARYVSGRKAYLYGHKFSNSAEIRAGDVLHVRSKSGSHYIVVLYRHGNKLVTIEGNCNGRIHRSSRMWRMKGDRFCGPKGFVRGWHLSFIGDRTNAPDGIRTITRWKKVKVRRRK